MNRRQFLRGALSLAAAAWLHPLVSLEEGVARAEGELPWWKTTIVYEIYPKSFADTTGNGTGDLNGVTAHLDYLASLGVGAIWLTPVYPSPMVDNGYDISDYTGIDPDYGTMGDFDRLVAEGRKRGIRIVMDLVYNHSSDRHPWFLASRKDCTNAKADWYIWRDAKKDGGPPTNWRSIFGGSAWTWCEERKQYYLHTFAEAQPDLNWENPKVRRALYDAANFWLDRGVGGFRIDAITYIKKPAVFRDGPPDGKDGMSAIHPITANTPGILDFLREFRREVFDGHDIFTVGEANGVNPEELPAWVGTEGVFDMLFEFSHMNLPLKNGETWCRPTWWKLPDLKREISVSQEITRNSGWVPVFFENHDQPRCVNHFVAPGADTFRAAKVIAAVLLTLRGTPFIYEGQELGMENVTWDSIDRYNDISSRGQYEFALQEGFTPEQAMKFVRYFSRDNARTPMQWDDSPNAGFTVGTPWLPVHENYRRVNVATESVDADSVLSWYRTLSALRRQRRELTEGSYEELLPDDEKIFAFARALGDRRIVTAANFSRFPAELPKGFAAGKTLLLAGDPPGEPETMAPLEARIYEERK